MIKVLPSQVPGAPPVADDELPELERRRLEKSVGSEEWTPEQILMAALEDCRANKMHPTIAGGVCKKLMVIACVEQPDQRVRLVGYRAGFPSAADEVAHIAAYADKLMRDWKGDGDG